MAGKPESCGVKRAAKNGGCYEKKDPFGDGFLLLAALDFNAMRDWVKKLGFGLMRLPVFDEADRSTVDLVLMRKMVDRFMARGFTCFDTAHRYNDEGSEPAIRETLVKRYPRDSYLLANKITLNYIKEPSDQELFFKNQLAICGVEYFDNYLIHNVGMVSYPAFEKLGTFDFVRQMRDKGYAKHIGFSFHGTAELLEEILRAHPDVDFVQLQINYLDWEDSNIQSRKCYEVARKHGKSVVVMEPVKGGTLVNLPDEAAKLLKEANPQASLASWAISYAAGLPGVLTVLSGMSTQEQMDDNTEYMQSFQPLTAQEREVLERVAELIHAKTVIGCTGCRYCVAECPQRIAIPEYFDLYNNMKRLKTLRILRIRLSIMVTSPRGAAKRRTVFTAACARKIALRICLFGSCWARWRWTWKEGKSRRNRGRMRNESIAGKRKPE